MGDNRSSSSAFDQTAEQFHILVDSVEEYAIYMLRSERQCGDVEHRRTENQRLLGRRNCREKTLPASIPQRTLPADKPQRNLREAARRGHIRDQGIRVRKDGSIFEAEVILDSPVRC